MRRKLIGEGRLGASLQERFSRRVTPGLPAEGAATIHSENLSGYVNCVTR